MSVRKASTARQRLATLAVAASGACATQVDAPSDIIVAPEGVGGSDIAGTGATGGSAVASGGTGGSLAGAGGTTTGVGGSTGGTGGSGAVDQGTGGSAGGGAGGRGSAGRAPGRAGSGGSTAMTGRGGRAGSSVGQGGGATSGCAKLSVPLNATNDKAHFVTSFSTPVDLSRATISMRFYVEAGSGGVIFNYVQDSSDRFLGAAVRPALSASVGAWSTLTWDVGAEAPAMTGVTKTSIKRLGIEINASGATAWTNPTVILVDSITVTTPARSFTFDATSSVNTMPTSTDVATQALWLNSNTQDTTAARSALSWQATCP